MFFLTVFMAGFRSDAEVCLIFCPHGTGINVANA